jgi:hypothetical protein
MTELQAMLHQTHPYIPLYKQAFLIIRGKSPAEQQKVLVKLHMEKNADGCTYNLPTTDKIVAIIPGNSSEHKSND